MWYRSFACVVRPAHFCFGPGGVSHPKTWWSLNTYTNSKKGWSLSLVRPDIGVCPSHVELLLVVHLWGVYLAWWLSTKLKNHPKMGHGPDMVNSPDVVAPKNNQKGWVHTQIVNKMYAFRGMRGDLVCGDPGSGIRESWCGVSLGGVYHTFGMVF